MRSALAEKPVALNVTPSRVLRCYVYLDRSGLYVAECIDLDILVKRKTAKQATRELKHAIVAYLTVVLQSPDTKGLFPRPSPFTHRLRYFWAKLRHNLSSNSSDRAYEVDSQASLSTC